MGQKKRDSNTTGVEICTKSVKGDNWTISTTEKRRGGKAREKKRRRWNKWGKKITQKREDRPQWRKEELPR